MQSVYKKTPKLEGVYQIPSCFWWNVQKEFCAEMSACIPGFLGHWQTRSMVKEPLIPPFLGLPRSCWLFRCLLQSHWQLDQGRFWAPEECRQTLSYAVVQHPRGTLQQWLQPRNPRVTAVAFRGKVCWETAEACHIKKSKPRTPRWTQWGESSGWLSPVIRTSGTTLSYRTVFNDRNISYLSSPTLQLLSTFVQGTLTVWLSGWHTTSMMLAALIQSHMAKRYFNKTG